jgi:hypothetical protein
VGLGERDIDPHGSQLASTRDVPPNVCLEPGGRPTPAGWLAAIIDASPCSRPPVVAGAMFAKDDKLGVDLVAPVPTGAKCFTPPYRAAGR